MVGRRGTIPACGAAFKVSTADGLGRSLEARLRFRAPDHFKVAVLVMPFSSDAKVMRGPMALGCICAASFSLVATWGGVGCLRPRQFWR